MKLEEEKKIKLKLRLAIKSVWFCKYLRNGSSDLYERFCIRFCQRWIVEFKEIMQAALFMVFFNDFVTLG